MVHGVGCWVYYGVWCRVYGARCSVEDVGRMMYDVWCTVCGVGCKMYGGVRAGADRTVVRPISRKPKDTPSTEFMPVPRK